MCTMRVISDVTKSMNRSSRMRARSNSAESWIAMQNDKVTPSSHETSKLAGIYYTNCLN